MIVNRREDLDGPRQKTSDGQEARMRILTSAGHGGLAHGGAEERQLCKTSDEP